MNPKREAGLAVGIGIALIALPLYLALHQSRQLSIQTAKRVTELAAGEVLRRSEETNRQIIRARGVLLASGSGDPCSEANIARMRQLDVSSSYIQSVGAVAGDKLICTSLGALDPGIPLGPVDFVTPSGWTARTSVSLPSVPGRVVVWEKSGYASIVHQELAIDVGTGNPDLSLGLVAIPSGKRIVGRGHFDPAWFDGIGTAPAFRHGDGYLVAITPSPDHEFASYAAVPEAFIAASTKEMAKSLIPIGAILGVFALIPLTYYLRRKTSLPAVIKYALKADQFFVHYQPVVELATRRCVGAEVLVRWRRSDGTSVGPDLFIPVAEEFGLIRQLTARVMEKVKNDAGMILAVAPDFHLSINLSPEDLRSHEIVGQLSEFLAATRMAPASLHVEMTERGMANTEHTRNIVKAIRRLGIEVAIDDFGTGFSSLSYLTSFDVDYLKIDKSFVDTLGTTAVSSHVSTHIISMARKLNLQMIAEGVETEEQATILREASVEYAQGWLFAKAMSPGDLVTYLRNQDSRPPGPGTAGAQG